MDTTNWLDKILSDPVAISTLVLALVTAILAVAAFRSIKEQRKERKEDRKERLLNEIIQWATEIIKWDIDASFESFEAKKELKEAMELKDAKEYFTMSLIQLFRFSGGFGEAKRRGKLTIRPLTLVFKCKSLTNVVDTLLEDLQRQLELCGLQEMAMMEDIIAKAQTLSNEFNLAQTQVINHKKLLDETANKVIEEAIKIKASL